MSRSYSETIAALKEELLELEERRSDFTAQLEKTNKRIAQVIESINSLTRLEPGKVAQLIGDPASQSGLSAAVRQVFRADPGWLYPTEVRDRLANSGYDISQHSNILASVHTCLKRLAEADEIGSKEIEGKLAYGKPPSLSGSLVTRQLPDFEKRTRKKE